MDTKLTKLEKKAFEVALSGNEPWKEQLRQQVPKLKVTKREYTGVGFYTDFICENCKPATDLPMSGSPENVPVAWASHPDVLNGADGAITLNVFLQDGIICVLEGASSANWPETEDLIIFSVDQGKT